MNRYPILISFILLICLRSPAQEPLVSFDDLTFNSTIERDILTNHFLNKKTDLFQLFMANGRLLNEASLLKGQQRFSDHLKELDQKTAAIKKNDKKIKVIYTDIHQTFLQKYEEVNSFEDVFYNGYYNCVSATALFGLAFNRLSVPYAIKEEPTHIYLIAYPNSERIRVETTTPSLLLKPIDETFKQSFVNTLKAQKRISAQEFASKSTNSLFDQYYFGNQMELTLFNLVGIQYMNDAIEQYEAKKPEQAYMQLEKAYLFYPSEKIVYMLLMAGTTALEDRKVKDVTHATYLGKLSRFKNYGITSDIIVGEFSLVIHKLLFEEGQLEKLNSYHTSLKKGVSDIQTNVEIEFLYNFELGRYYYNNAKYKEALPYFETCIDLKPNHLDATTGFLSALSRSLDTSPGNNLQIIKSLESYASLHPGLHQNNTFNNMMATTNLVQFTQDYGFDRAAEGERNKDLFERYIEKHPDLPLNHNLIGQAYSVAAVYYFRKGQTAKAKSIISHGLLISPNNYELLTRQRMIR
ncbi:MAG: tetratricopeptide repeat protein [Cyclobacteriaceae bacterium]|nr:tetratricopeptide repeat protein [Cyclobacteriaceae bacterium]